MRNINVQTLWNFKKKEKKNNQITKAVQKYTYMYYVCFLKIKTDIPTGK